MSGSCDTAHTWPQVLHCGNERMQTAVHHPASQHLTGALEHQLSVGKEKGLEVEGRSHIDLVCLIVTVQSGTAKIEKSST